MTPEEFTRQIKCHSDEFEKLVDRVLPIKVGALAKKHFQENFRKGGFVNGGLHRWKPSKRIGKAKGANGKYGTLLSSRNHLFSSIEYVPGAGEVTIQNKVHYAAVHNEGLKAGRGKGFKMPKRQFIGDSKELNSKINQTIEQEIKNIINK